MADSLDPLAFIPPPLLELGKPSAPPPSLRPTPLSARAAPSPPPRRPIAFGTLKGFDVPDNMTGAALQKMRIIRDEVVKPGTTGPGLAYTRAVLGEILKGAPASVNGHNAGKWNLVQRIFYWIRGRVRYVLDPSRRELFQQLPVTLKGGIGDCDDFTGALAVLLKAAGFRVKARCIEVRRGRGWAHIYPLVEIGGRWLALDATTNNPPGWEPAHTRVSDLEL